MSHCVHVHILFPNPLSYLHNPVSIRIPMHSLQQSLARAFQQFGAVKEAIVLLEQHDRSKGCGFVIFESAMAARQAMSMAVLVDGRQVQCDYAFKGNPKKVFINQPVISPEQRLAADGRRLFIHDLAWKTTDETLRQAFLQYGEIQEAVVIHDRKTRKSKGTQSIVHSIFTISSISSIFSISLRNCDLMP